MWTFLAKPTLINIIVFLIQLFYVCRAARTRQVDEFLSLDGSYNHSYFGLTSGCVEDFYKTRTTQGNPPRYCRMNNLVASFVSPISNGVALKCKYEITAFRYVSSDSGVTVEFNVIHTFECTSGGSSFTMQIVNSIASQYVWCDFVYDSSMKRYSFTCVIPHSAFNPDRCGSVQIQLDYEDYNAYLDGVPMLPLRRILSGPDGATSFAVCSSVSNSESQSSLPSTTANVSKCLNNAPLYMIGSSHMRYLWDSVVDKYLDGRSTLLGLPQHHSDATVGQVHYVSSLFVMQLPSLLDSLCDSIHDALQDSDTSKASPLKRWRVVVQSLAWDLDYHPLRNVLQYPSSVPALVEAVRRLATQRCGQIDFTWVTAVPVPPCNASEASSTAEGVRSGTSVGGHKRRTSSADCAADSRGYRNNHAIAAANEYIVEQLSNIKIMSKVGRILLNDDRLSPKRKRMKLKAGKIKEVPFVRVVDAFELIYPTHSESVCGLHYNCAKHKGKKSSPQKSVEILSTPGGDALLDSIIKSVCNV